MHPNDDDPRHHWSRVVLSFQLLWGVCIGPNTRVRFAPPIPYPDTQLRAGHWWISWVQRIVRFSEGPRSRSSATLPLRRSWRLSPLASWVVVTSDVRSAAMRSYFARFALRPRWSLLVTASRPVFHLGASPCPSVRWRGHRVSATALRIAAFFPTVPYGGRVTSDFRPSGLGGGDRGPVLGDPIAWSPPFPTSTPLAGR
jgi:hypothetical protein